MYKYVQGSAESKGNPGQWVAVDLSILTLAEIFQRYTGAYAILEVVELKQQYSLNLFNLPSQLRTVPMTFNDWLIGIGNAALPLDENLPTKNKVYATYRDAWTWGFQIQGFNRNISEKQPLTADQIIDIRITKAGVDYKAIDDYCLHVVNGLVHNSFYSVGGTIVPEAGRSAMYAKDNRVGLINFEKIGKIKRIPITPDMVVKNPDGLLYKEAVYLSAGNVDLTNKTVGLVIGGYFHLLDGAYDQVGTNLIKVYMLQYPLVTRYWEMKHRIALPGFNVSEWHNRDDKVSYEELSSDANILALFTLPQSFIVTIDSTSVGVEYKLAHQAELAGRYMAYSPPRCPLVNANGMLSNYTWYKAKHDYVVRTSDYFYTNLMRHTFEYKKNQFTTEHRYVHKPTVYQPSRWMEIYRVID